MEEEKEQKGEKWEDEKEEEDNGDKGFSTQHNNGNKCHHHETKLGCLLTKKYNQFHLLCIPTQPTYIYIMTTN